MATQQEILLQMIAQLRLLDPSVLAEVGTPERKLLDTVASALSGAEIDLIQLQGALDVDSKIGSNLDNFLALFGFGRQQAVKSTGFIEFSRTLPATSDIRIPTGTQIKTSAVDEIESVTDTIFQTTLDASILTGESSTEVPIRAIFPGTLSNVASNSIHQWAGNVIYGIHNINNVLPTTGGTDVENDDEYKVRFKNTVFRNLAGTQDQYAALAASAAFTTKANVVGPISRFREYIQVPSIDDASSVNIDPETDGPGSIPESGNGTANVFSSAMSIIPYSKHTYTTVPIFISNGNSGADTVFWRQEVDWALNIDPEDKNRGDAYRFWNNDGPFKIGGDPLDTENIYQPSVTFTNVFTGTDTGVTAIRPGQTVLFEHSYMSTSSRNDFEHNVSNCVDLFIDGLNDTVAQTIVPGPGVHTTNAFFLGPTTYKYYKGNYRRDGEPDVTPVSGHIFIPLFWQPVTALPSSITVTDDETSATYFLNEHYWLVTDVSELHGTVRARNGIEWNASLAGAEGTKALNEFAANTPIPIDGYVFDKNIVDLQSAVEASKQVTTDVLVHRARIRYFKLDVTIMYLPGASQTQVNNSIHDGVENFFNNRYFGNIVQLSDLLQAIHNVVGVDNVRWSSDIPGNADLNRINETNRFGSDIESLSINTDFALKDDELPSLSEEIAEADQDSRLFNAVPGLIIRSRAQNTFLAAT